MTNTEINVPTKYITRGVVVITGVFILFIGFLVFGSGSQSNTNSERPQSGSNTIESDGFLGDVGATTLSEEGFIYIDEDEVSDGNMHPFHYFSEKESKNIYFFVVKASDGSYRVAANACEVCHGTKKGFSQVGDQIKCNNCGTYYAKDQIALQKGGCNPGPIDANAPVVNGEVTIRVSDVEAVSYLF